MPGYKVHIGGGILTSIVVVYSGIPERCGLTCSPLVYGGCLLACVIGALAPDIDTKSRGRHYYDRLLMMALCSAGLLGSLTCLIGCGIAFVMPRLLRHRGITHNLWFIVGITLTAVWLIQGYTVRWRAPLSLAVLCLAAGAISHVALDSQPFFKDRRR